MKRILLSFFMTLIMVAAGLSAYLGYRILEGYPPVITPVEIPSIVGKSAIIKIEAKDEKAGIRAIEAYIVQGEKKTNIFAKEYPLENRLIGSHLKSVPVSFQVQPVKAGIKPGKAVIEIIARDAALRNGGKGNQAILKIPLQVDYIPPMLTVLSTAHNVRVGGCSAISFTVNEPVVRAGVRIDDAFFKAYRDENGIFRAIFAIPFDLDNPQKVFVEAEDRAGNKGIGGFYYRILPRRKKRDKINISDSFLQKKMPEFANRFPEMAAPSLLETFLKVNKILRAKNNEFLLSLSKKSQPKMLWSGSFKRFAGAQRSGFADERHYFYKGKEIDQAYHMGIDIASFAHAQVPAANSGRVLFTGYNGIYGNTVVIDHGMGLLSLYAHLSQILVSEGQMVNKGQIIGKTGMTGLAGGDHLHFGMILQGIFINPMQWWDKKWVREHIMVNLSVPR